MTDLQEQFEAYHAKHPEVWTAFEAMALKMINNGKKRSSADKVFHEIRFETRVSGKPDDRYKVNNNYVSRYSRMFLDAHPEHPDFFTTRKLSIERVNNKAA